MKNSRIIPAAVFYGISVFLAEATFGDPEFPFSLWAYDSRPAYLWSVPVHAAGFLWLVFWNNMFVQKHIIFPTIFATVFFLAGETLNWFFFDYFKYQKTFFGSAGFSFWIIIGMYFILCVTTTIILRSHQD